MRVGKPDTPRESDKMRVCKPDTSQKLNSEPHRPQLNHANTIVSAPHKPERVSILTT